MKQITAFILITAIAVSFFSCDPNRKCEDTNCPLYTICQNGQCLCPAGYEGEFCEILSYEKYLGNYQVNENCTPNPGSLYPVTILKSGADAQNVTITNMLGIGLAAEAFVSGNFITIPNQKMGAITINGDGVYNNVTKHIELRYQHDYGNDLNTCTSIFILY